MKKKMRFFVFWPIFKIKIAIKTAEIGLEYLDNRSRLMSKMEALQEHPLRLVKFINQFPLFQYSRPISVKELILIKNNLAMKKKMRFFVFWPIFKIKIAIKTAEIGLEYLDNRSRLMSKMEALQEHPLRLVNFINQFCSLTDFYCPNIQGQFLLFLLQF